MKARNSLRLPPLRTLTVCLSTLIGSGGVLAAATHYWNVGGTGGDGNWGTTPGDKNWNLVAGAPAGNTVWPDGIDDVAVFQDAIGGTVTVFDPVQTHGIVQSGADYVINAANITLARNAALADPFIEVQSGVLTIDSVLEGSAGMQKTGGGNLLLTSHSLVTGTTSVAAGTLTLSGSLASTGVEIAEGAVLLDQAGGLASATALINAGTLDLAADDTVETYTQNGGGVFSGAGALTTTAGATLNGGTVYGTLLGDTTSTGAVRVYGSLGGGSLAVTGGTLELIGNADSMPVAISAGATVLDQSGGFGTSADLTNAGTLAVNAADTVGSYTQNGGGVLSGISSLTTLNGSTLNGGTVSGTLLGTITSTGDVRISGFTGGGSLAVTDGTLTLTGTSTHLPVSISTPATLVDHNGGLDRNTILTNAGRLTLDAADTIACYISNGGTLTAGPGILTTTHADLHQGSSIAGILRADTLASRGAVSVSGSATADRIRIESGVLTNTGTLGSASTRLDIASGATLVADGTQNYALLSTSGPGAGIWQGDLTNPSVIAPGGELNAGALRVKGDFTHGKSGTLKLDASALDHDLIKVDGTATFRGALELHQLGIDGIAPFVSIQVVAADAYAGNITSFSENLDGAVFFNPRSGEILRITPPADAGTRLFGATENQTATWISLYDDVIDPGTTNVTSTAGPVPEYQVTTGIADPNNPDLLWALSASFAPGGLNADLLNRLSPEVYTGFQDYAAQATRKHLQAALSAPALGPAAPAPSAKGGSKEAIKPAPSLRDWEFFAAADFFEVETDHSPNLADYELKSTGLLAGARTSVAHATRLAGYLAADDGSIDGPLIDADGTGWSVGLISETLLDEKSRTTLTAALSYGRYSFDGTRGSASASAAGWAPGDVDFSNVNSHALELFLGIEGTAYQDKRIRVIPAFGLRYASTTMDNFSETTGAGAPIALDVARDHDESMLAEASVLAEADLTDQLTLWGRVGCNGGIGEDSHVLRASFAKGSRPMRIEADGLTDDLLFLGIGADYQVSDALSVGLGYRAEFRSGHHTEQGCAVSTSFRF